MAITKYQHRIGWWFLGRHGALALEGRGARLIVAADVFVAQQLDFIRKPFNLIGQFTIVVGFHCHLLRRRLIGVVSGIRWIIRNGTKTTEAQSTAKEKLIAEGIEGAEASAAEEKWTPKTEIIEPKEMAAKAEVIEIAKAIKPAKTEAAANSQSTAWNKPIGENGTTRDKPPGAGNGASENPSLRWSGKTGWAGEARTNWPCRMLTESRHRHAMGRETWSASWSRDSTTAKATLSMRRKGHQRRCKEDGNIPTPLHGLSVAKVKLGIVKN